MKEYLKNIWKGYHEINDTHVLLDKQRKNSKFLDLELKVFEHSAILFITGFNIYEIITTKSIDSSHAAVEGLALGMDLFKNKMADSFAITYRIGKGFYRICHEDLKSQEN